MSKMALFCSFVKTPNRLSTTVHERLQGNPACSGATAVQTHFSIRLQRCEFRGEGHFFLKRQIGGSQRPGGGGDTGIRTRAASMGAISREEERERTREQELQGPQVETVVIVGAGLAGLATALALHREHTIFIPLTAS